MLQTKKENQTKQKTRISKQTNKKNQNKSMTAESKLFYLIHKPFLSIKHTEVP